MRRRSAKKQIKQIFVTSFNCFKKALTFDEICAKVRPYRDRMLVLVDEVDDFLDRDKLIFNICSNKGNEFQKPTLRRYFEVRVPAVGSPCARRGRTVGSAVGGSAVGIAVGSPSGRVMCLRYRR